MQGVSRFGWTVFMALSIALSNSPLRAAEGTWKVGMARIEITPQKPMWLAGYGHRNRPADGKLTGLWVKVLALEAADGTRGVIVTSDLLGFPRAVYEAVYAELHKDPGLDQGQLVLTCSHTHSGPVLTGALYDCYPLDDTQRSLIEDYSQKLVGKVVAAVRDAMAHMMPATLWTGQGSAAFAVNRRNNTEAKVPKLREDGIALKGPIDHDVPVLVVRTPDGAIRAVLFGYACHATTLDGYQWCGDHPGYAQLALEEKHPGLQAMFYIGCGADQNPIPRRSVELCKKYGTMLATAVEEVLGGKLERLSPSLKTAFQQVDIGLEGIPTHQTLQAEAKQNVVYARRAERIGKLLDQHTPLATSTPIPVQAWKLGDRQLWILLGGEVVVDYALMFKKRYGRQTWVAGYSNYVMGYVPSERVWKEGGYEANAFYVYGVAANRWAPDIQQKLTSAVDRLVQRLQ